MQISSYLSDIDASCLLPLCMPVPELCDHADGVESSVLSQGGWDDLHGLSKRLEAVSLHAGQSTAVLIHAMGHLNLWGTTTGYQGSVANKQRSPGIKQIIIQLA